MKEDDDHLVEHQKNWLKLGHIYFALDRVADFASTLATELCNIIPIQIPVPLVGPIPNPIHYVCMISPLVMTPVFHAMKIAAGIAYQMVSHTFELATLGEQVFCHTHKISIQYQYYSFRILFLYNVKDRMLLYTDGIIARQHMKI